MHILLEKIRDNVALLKNLNKGDIMIFGKSEFAEDVVVSPNNIFWVEYSNHRQVSLKSFDGRNQIYDYIDFESSKYWYLVRLSLYLAGHCF